MSADQMGILVPPGLTIPGDIFTFISKIKSSTGRSLVAGDRLCDHVLCICGRSLNA